MMLHLGVKKSKIVWPALRVAVPNPTASIDRQSAVHRGSGVRLQTQRQLLRPSESRFSLCKGRKRRRRRPRPFLLLWWWLPGHHWLRPVLHTVVVIVTRFLFNLGIYYLGNLFGKYIIVSNWLLEIKFRVKVTHNSRFLKYQIDFH